MPATENEIKEAYREIREITGLEFDETDRNQAARALSQIYINGHNLWYGVKKWPRLDSVDSDHIIEVRDALRQARDVNNTDFVCIMKQDDRYARPRMIRCEEPLDAMGNKLPLTEEVAEKLRQKQQAAQEYAENFEKKREARFRELRESRETVFAEERKNLTDLTQYFDRELLDESGQNFRSRPVGTHFTEFIKQKTIREIPALCNALLLARGYTWEELYGSSEQIQEAKKKVGREVADLIWNTQISDSEAGKRFGNFLDEISGVINKMQFKYVDFSDESTLRNLPENEYSRRAMMQGLYDLGDSYLWASPKIKRYREIFMKSVCYARDIVDFDNSRILDAKKSISDMAEVMEYQILMDHMGPDYSSYRTAPFDIAGVDYNYDSFTRTASRIMTEETGRYYSRNVGESYKKAYNEFCETGNTEEYGKLLRGNFKEAKAAVDKMEKTIQRVAEGKGLAPIKEMPEEEPEMEEIEAEENEVEEPKVEEAKAEEPKAEAPKAEKPKVEEAKAEESKVEESKVEEPRVEEPKAEKAGVEEPKAEEPEEEISDEWGPEIEETEQKAGKQAEQEEPAYPWMDDEYEVYRDDYRERLQDLYDQLDSHDPFFLRSSAEYKAVKSGLKEAMKQMDQADELRYNGQENSDRHKEAIAKFNKAMGKVYQNSEAYLQKKKNAPIGKHYGQERLDAIRNVRATLYRQGPTLTGERAVDMFRIGAEYGKESFGNGQLKKENGLIRLGIYIQRAKETGNKADMQLLNKVVAERGKNGKNLQLLWKKLNALNAKLPKEEQVADRAEAMEKTKELLCRKISAQKGMSPEMISWCGVLEGFRDVAEGSELGQVKEIARDQKVQKIMLVGQIGARTYDIRRELHSSKAPRYFSSEDVGVMIANDTFEQLMAHKSEEDKAIFNSFLKDKKNVKEVVDYFDGLDMEKQFRPINDWEKDEKINRLDTPEARKIIGEQGKKEVIKSMLKENRKQHAPARNAAQKQKPVNLP